METARLSPPVLPRDHVLGRSDAPITLVEFADLQCPHCRRAHLVLKEVRKVFGDNLRYVFRHFPLTDRHPDALNAALAAESASVQGLFWPMVDLLFQHQGALDLPDLLTYAKMLSLDEGQFERDLRSGRFVERIREDFQSGERSDIQGTPTFYLNGERYDGDWRDTQTFIRALHDAMPPMESPGVSP